MRKLVWSLWAGVVAYVIALLLQGVWTALLVTNLRKSAATPWSVPLMALVLFGAWLWLGGSFGPAKTREWRREHLRAEKVDVPVLVETCVAGGVGLIALSGLWIVLAETVEVPVSSLPDIGKYPPFTAYSIVAMGALVGAVLEEAGFRGYAQVMLEKYFRPAMAAFVSSVLFSIGPHPPTHGFLLPKIAFYFLVAVLLSAIAQAARSIIPAVVVHTLGLAVFFSLIWSHDAERQLIWGRGTDSWFWIHLVQFVVCSTLAIAMFGRIFARKPAAAAASV